MNRCGICGRKLKNNETTFGVEFCKVCERYEQQLAEKDKEIATLNKTIFRIENEKANIIQKEMIDYLSFAKQIRKQVCDEIREKLKKQIIPTGGTWLSYYDITETNNLLDQIEKEV